MKSDINKFFPYFTEIKRRLFLTVAIFIVASVLGFFYYDKIINISLKIFRLEGVNIVFTSPFQFIELSINSGLLVGIIVVFPLLIWQILSFLRPALTRNEFKMIVSLAPISVFLFVFGFGFGVYIMQYIIQIFYRQSIELEIGNFLDVTRLLSQVMVTASLMGVAFQFPIVLTLMIKFGVVKVETLVHQRMVAWGASILFAAFLPPTDILSLVLLTLPLVILYELTILLNRKFVKPKRR